MNAGAESLARRVWEHVPEPGRRLVRFIRFKAPAEKQWMRVIMNRQAETWFRSLPLGQLEALEVSGKLRSSLPWKAYTDLHYPDLDLCAAERPSQSYDVVICEQVLEHVPDLTAAVATLHALCRPGGLLYVSTPFLIKIHGHPDDYWRLTASGMRVLLERGGFEAVSVDTWGNGRCVRGNLGGWAYYFPWRSLKNNPELPVVVWATARRPQ